MPWRLFWLFYTKVKRCLTLNGEWWLVDAFAFRCYFRYFSFQNLFILVYILHGSLYTACCTTRQAKIEPEPEPEKNNNNSNPVLKKRVIKLSLWQRDFSFTEVTLLGRKWDTKVATRSNVSRNATTVLADNKCNHKQTADKSDRRQIKSQQTLISDLHGDKFVFKILQTVVLTRLQNKHETSFSRCFFFKTSLPGNNYFGNII